MRLANLWSCYQIVLIILLGGLSSKAFSAEGLEVNFKVRSMYYDPTDPDTNPNSLGGTVVNGVPDETRADAMDTWYKANNSNDNRFHYYFGWRKANIQPKGSISVVVWLERASDGKFIKTLGRWCGHSSHGTWPNSKKNNRVYGTEVYHDPYYFVHGWEAGRAYDLMRWNGAYGSAAGSTSGNIRALGDGSNPIHSVRGASPFDGVTTDYDAVLGPTIGIRIEGSASNTANLTQTSGSLEEYLNPDDPSTLADDADILTTVPTIPYRSGGNQPTAWNFQLEWDPENDVDSSPPYDLVAGDYNIIIEAVEWAGEGEFYSAIGNSGQNTAASIAFFRPLDHFKSIGYTYDGKSWTLRSGENTNDYYATDSMRREGDNTDSYSNPFTGNTITRGSNEPAIIYDINVNYTPPAAPVASITTPSSSQLVLDSATVNFVGTGTDAEDGTLTGTDLQWTSNLDGSINSGASFSTSSLSVGAHTITLTVTDSDGQSDTDTVAVTVHQAPTASISTGTQTINAGSTINLVGSGSDPDGGTSTYSWSSNIQGSLGTTATVNNVSLNTGTHTITFTVTDDEGVSTNDTVVITVNAIPAANITTPSSSQVIDAGDTINFAGTATDTEDGGLTGVWTSNLDGSLNTGNSFSTSGLSTGTHTITFTATDSNSAQDTDTVTVRVNAYPVVNITAPTDSSNFTTGATVNFTSTATDAEGALNSSNLQWSSNIDGAIGTGTSTSSSSLSVGTHIITFSATDSDGAVSSTTVSITLTDPLNDSPIATITSPSGTTNINIGTNINLAGSATDTEDGTIPGVDLAWSSNIDGALGTGTSLNNIPLSAGSHTITLTATDSGSATGTDTVTVNVNAAPTANITTSGGQTFVTGSTITLDGTGTDPEDGALTGVSLEWRNGASALGTGVQYSSSAFTAGNYTITLLVTDAGGLTDTDTVSFTVDDAPVIDITAPSDGVVVTLGNSVSLSATATDSEDGNIAANIIWSSNLDGNLGSGASRSPVLTVGSHTITASITDAAGTVRTDTVNVIVNTLPVASIQGPPTNTVYLAGANINFLGTATDAEDGTLSGTSLAWTSDIDGALNTGASINTTTLSTGTHIITLTATDSNGGTHADTITVIVHTIPTVSLDTPTTNTVAGVGTTVNFSATATDAEDGALTGASVQWTSDRDGNIGNDVSLSSSTLSAGTHVITVTATDSRGESVTDTITLYINTDPQVNITAPSASTFTFGDTVNFNADAQDNEDGALSGNSVVWDSDRDGQLSTGTSFSSTSLSLGTHVITVTVTDARGVTATDTKNITVVAAPTVPETFTLTFDTNTIPGTYAPTNVVAVWVETQTGTFIKTLGRWSGERTYSLETWETASGGGDVDAIMGATRANHSAQLTVSWNINSTINADGVYKIWLEMAESDTYLEGPPSLTSITLNKNGTPAGNSSFSIGGFDIGSWTYSGRAPQITSLLTDSAQSGQAYSYTITAVNGPTSFSASGLPSGLSIDTATGIISGTPIGAGPVNISINATNSAGTDSQTLVLDLDATPIITSSLSSTGEETVAYSYTITALNNPTSFNATGLPNGLGIDPVTGVISGTPSENGNFNVIISAINGDGTDSEILVLSIGAFGTPVISSANSLIIEEGVAVNFAVTATNTPTGFSATGLPSGLSIDTVTGVISGTAANATANPLNPMAVQIQASNGAGSGPAQSFTLTIHYHPSVARTIMIEVLDPLNPVSTSVSADQAGSSVYSASGQTQHTIQAIDKDVSSTIQFGAQPDHSADSLMAPN